MMMINSQGTKIITGVTLMSQSEENVFYNENVYYGHSYTTLHERFLLI